MRVSRHVFAFFEKTGFFFDLLGIPKTKKRIHPITDGFFAYQRVTIHCATSRTKGIVPTDRREDVPTVWEA